MKVMKSKQLYLINQKSNNSYNKEDYFISTSNRRVYQGLIEAPWPSNCAIIIGPEKSGKTHLANIWAKVNSGVFVNKPDPEKIRTISNNSISYSSNKNNKHNQANNIIIENIERFNSKADLIELLHCYNNAEENKSLLLLTVTTDDDKYNNTYNYYNYSNTGTGALVFTKALPDLSSRLMASTHFIIPPADEDLLKVIIYQQFYLLQLHVNGRIVNFILNKVERSIKAIIEFIGFLNENFLSINKGISLKFIHEVFEDYQEIKKTNMGLADKNAYD